MLSLGGKTVLELFLEFIYGPGSQYAKVDKVRIDNKWTCFVKENKLLEVNKINGTERKVGNAYSFDVLEGPTPDNPYANLEFYEADKYSYRTVNHFEKVSVPAKGAIHVFGISCSLLTGIACSNNTQWFHADTKPEEAFSAGLLLGAIPWLFAVLIHKDKMDQIIVDQKVKANKDAKEGHHGGEHHEEGASEEGGEHN